MNAMRQKRLRERRKKEKELENAEGKADESKVSDNEDSGALETSALPLINVTGVGHGCKRNDWYTPLLWNSIVTALNSCNFSARKAVKLLKSSFPDGRFSKLAPSTVQGWFMRTTAGIIWVAKVLEKVERGKSMFQGRSSGSQQALAQFPEVVSKCIELLKACRKSGAVVNSSIARSIILGVISEKVPHLLNLGLKFERRWVRSFVSINLAWSFRSPTEGRINAS
eukprot:TRINITY_DN34_c0_g1_i13.p3 TRINITY_DN34_c0_g1~~TRINITY_DN34_c0_g1_i13.p3  ORF type:complete len:225 (+),score=64.49 TRINITY_DN34_c0_g1_i13:1699-2373(+)